MWVKEQWQHRGLNGTQGRSYILRVTGCVCEHHAWRKEMQGIWVCHPHNATRSRHSCMHTTPMPLQDQRN